MRHRYHPDTEADDPADLDPVDAILFDDCADCARHAEKLGTSLDGEKFLAMWLRMLEAESGAGHYRTGTEARLGRSLHEVRILLERHPDLATLTVYALGAKEAGVPMTDAVDSLLTVMGRLGGESVGDTS